MQRYTALALDNIRREPAAFAAASLYRMLRMFVIQGSTDRGTAQQFRGSALIYAAAFGVSVVYLLLFASGAVIAWRRRSPVRTLLLPIAYVPLTICFVLTNMRYTVTVQPLMFVFVAIALTAALERWTPWRGTNGAGHGAVLVACVNSDWLLVFWLPQRWSTSMALISSSRRCTESRRDRLRLARIRHRHLSRDLNGRFLPVLSRARRLLGHSHHGLLDGALRQDPSAIRDDRAAADGGRRTDERDARIFAGEPAVRPPLARWSRGAGIALTPAHYLHSRLAVDHLYPLPFVLGWLLCLQRVLDRCQPAVLFAGALALGIGFYSYLAAVILMPL